MIKAPTSFIQRLKFIGPSIIVTGSVVGSGSIALSPLLGAATGFALLWWLLLSLWSKPLIQAEISRYVIATNQTFLESFSDMPGPKTNLKGKKASWLVWFMFIGVIPSIAGMGGLAGAVAEAGHGVLFFSGYFNYCYLNAINTLCNFKHANLRRPYIFISL
jgi:Mn2+/Fe2+ NRAMP family transporter